MISVAMTTYNGEKYIKEQIMSIFNQSIEIDELVIVDDASTDSTVSIISNLKDPRIRLFVNDINKGYIENFYRAIEKTRGDYIFLSDQDDIWEYEKIETLIRVLNKRDCAAVCSNCSIIDSNGNKLKESHLNKFFIKKNYIVQKIDYRKLLFENVAQGCTYGFTKNVKECYLKIHEKNIIHDWQIMLISSLIGNVYFINKPLIRYRIHENNAVAFNTNIRLGFPSKKPKLVCFVEKINKVIQIKNNLLIYTYIVCYLRLPLIRTIIKKYWRLK